MQRFGALEVAMRQNDLAFEVQAYLKNHPCAAVVNLVHFTELSGRHSVLERPLSEVNGRLFFS